MKNEKESRRFIDFEPGDLIVNVHWADDYGYFYVILGSNKNTDAWIEVGRYGIHARVITTLGPERSRAWSLVL